MHVSLPARRLETSQVEICEGSGTNMPTPHTRPLAGPRCPKASHSSAGQEAHGEAFMQIMILMIETKTMSDQLRRCKKQ